MFNDVDENLEYVIRKERILALRETDEWAEFVERFDAKSDSNLSLLAELFEEKLGDDPSVEDYQRLLRNVLLAGGVVRIGGTQYEFEPVPETEQSPEPEVPVHRGQEMWREHAEFMRTGGNNGGPPSMDEVRERKRTSASFRAYVTQAYQAESDLLTNPVAKAEAEALWSVNPHLRPEQQQKVAVTEELMRFAKFYRELPTDRLKPRGGYIELSPEFRLTKEQFDRLVEKSTAAGLIA